MTCSIHANPPTQNVRNSANCGYAIDAIAETAYNRPIVGRTWRKSHKTYTVTERFSSDSYTVQVDGPDSVGFFNLTECHIRDLTE